MVIPINSINGSSLYGMFYSWFFQELLPAKTTGGVNWGGPGRTDWYAIVPHTALLAKGAKIEEEQDSMIIHGHAFCCCRSSCSWRSNNRRKLCCQILSCLL